MLVLECDYESKDQTKTVVVSSKQYFWVYLI